MLINGIEYLLSGWTTSVDQGIKRYAVGGKQHWFDPGDGSNLWQASLSVYGTEAEIRGLRAYLALRLPSSLTIQFSSSEPVFGAYLDYSSAITGTIFELDSIEWSDGVTASYKFGFSADMSARIIDTVTPRWHECFVQSVSVPEPLAFTSHAMQGHAMYTGSHGIITRETTLEVIATLRDSQELGKFLLENRTATFDVNYSGVDIFGRGDFGTQTVRCLAYEELGPVWPTNTTYFGFKITLGQDSI